MNRPCAGCGKWRCEGDCYTTEPEHDDEPTISKLTLEDCRILFCEEVEQLTETIGDPLLKRRAA